MRALAIVALVMALGGAVTCIYGFVETKPNVEANERRMEDSGPTSEKMQKLNRAVWQEYKDALSMQAYVSLALGILALGLGGFVAFKKEKIKLAGAGAALGVVVIIMAILLGA